MSSSLDSYKEKLSEFVSFESVSTSDKFKNGIEGAASWISDFLEDYGFKTELLNYPDLNPVVFANFHQSDDLETILVYGHYDVQPADSEKWTSAPYELRADDERWYARGIVDNKGQILIHMYAVANLIEKDELGYNVKFLIEGNEETGSSLAPILKDRKDDLGADYVLVSDGELIEGKPGIEASLRGATNLTLHYRTGKNNLHSGLYGGVVPNAAHELFKFLGKIYEDKEENHIAIPGFYDNVDDIEERHIKHTEKIFDGEDRFLNSAGVKKVLTRDELNPYAQIGLMPTIQVTGFESGYTDEGYSNIVPAKAEARINFRLVESQDPERLVELFEKFVEEHTPDYVEYEIDQAEAAAPVKVDLSSDKVKEVVELLEEAYNDDVMVKYVGGSIPFVTDIKRIFGQDTILVPFGNGDCNMHGVDENFKVDLIEKGLTFAELFWSKSY